MDLEVDTVINEQTKKTNDFIPHTHLSRVNSPSTTPTHPLKVQIFSLEEMVDHQRHGLCYNCDEKYAPSHRCKEYKLFQIDMTTLALTEELTIKETPKLLVEDTNTPILEDIEPQSPLENP
jgi:hypothetical protein